MEDDLCRMMEEYVAMSAENRFPDSGESYFAQPLIGFADGADPLFADYKRLIGAFHLSPGEVMESAYGEGVRAATVISWILPLTPATRESNRRQNRWPSREWAVTRDRGETFNTALRRQVIGWLEDRGHRAVAPQLAPCWKQLNDPAVGIASTWSERHAAYAAGLGTFSLNDGLITSRGIAHRIGSVITDLLIPPTPRSFPTHLYNCLWHREKSCGLCIGRCPVGAITHEGHDKEKCRAYVYGAVPEAVAGLYGVVQTGCGLCQTKVPCEATVPRGADVVAGKRMGDTAEPGEV